MFWFFGLVRKELVWLKAVWFLEAAPGVGYISRWGKVAASCGGIMKIIWRCLLMPGAARMWRKIAAEAHVCGRRSSCVHFYRTSTLLGTLMCLSSCWVSCLWIQWVTVVWTPGLTANTQGSQSRRQHSANAGEACWVVGKSSSSFWGEWLTPKERGVISA